LGLASPNPVQMLGDPVIFFHHAVLLVVSLMLPHCPGHPSPNPNPNPSPNPNPNPNPNPSPNPSSSPSPSLSPGQAATS
jgi:hypothetical protein